MLRSYSVVAAAMLEDLPCVDVVFLDAMKSATETDIKAWWPRVCSGGIIAGHDYRLPFDEVICAPVHRIGIAPVNLGPDFTWWVVKP